MGELITDKAIVLGSDAAQTSRIVRRAGRRMLMVMATPTGMTVRTMLAASVRVALLGMAPSRTQLGMTQCMVRPQRQGTGDGDNQREPSSELP
ncbi:MAG: hypothetical protein IT422_13185 [Pirellulaceae bacterium]|nr:hypothetical protein [Pirellulaceae bacterium]